MNKLIIFIIIISSNCLFAQINSSNFIGSYICTLTQWYSGSLTTIPNRTINIGAASANDYFLFDDGNFITSSGYYKLNNDSTFFDTLGASGSCRYGRFYNQDSIYFYMCASSGQWSKYYGKKISGVGINEFEKNDRLTIYPNPSSSKITIDVFTTLFIDEKNYISLKNALGQVILKAAFNSKQSEIDVSNFSNGIYFIEISLSNNLILNKKIVINR